MSEPQAQDALSTAIQDEDRASDRFDVIGDPRTGISLEPRGLVIVLPMYVFKTLVGGARVPVGKVVLDMVLDFIVRDGRILHKYKFFQPNTRSVIKPTFDVGGTLTCEIRSAVFAESDDILAALRTGINHEAEERLASVPDLQLFEITPELDQMALTLCPVEASTPSEATPVDPAECIRGCDEDQETCKKDGEISSGVCAQIHDACVGVCEQ